MIKFFKNRVIKSNKGISIIFAIIIIVLMGLAGSVFAYLMASSSITSRQNLLSAEAKYAAKSGIEIAMYQLKNSSNGNSNFSSSVPADVSCPTTPVIPQGVTLSLSTNYQYIYGNLAPNYSIDNYTPSFCALVAQQSNDNNTSCYIITANGQAGGTTREISAEVGIKTSASGNCASGGNNIIFVENELPNSNN
ncbi:MAG: hypothetical protein EVG15_02190 [Candidatus Acididesulfobacter diazotrophicus]|jgi:hypothetical protein|uniref:Type 4 fimbrial biogenesis protein PilX N-terminal domain-containing protein n=1 Tax=Candidatus Acididesulfobacter diazotrophicus TaxID=2597226 RepID=A0A519BPQ6_9DELT|nr:MAG: hypothetical protein EVG15_02190 [Candidatus Acididesulfobacter diazotrophicus]